MRLFHIQKINDYNRQQQEEADKRKSNAPPSNKVAKPGVSPSSTYNF
ncbi:hypothetical protein N9992_00145 [bacterium]|jgi:hypothetical protein|nr:hypothetical protein [bacterium]